MVVGVQIVDTMPPNASIDCPSRARRRCRGTLVTDDPDAGNFAHRAFVDRDRHSAGDRRADHPAVQHPD